MQVDSTVYHQSVHLDDDKLLSADAQCPFCKCADREPAFVLQENPEVLLLRCTNCNAASAARMPTDEALAEYYRGYWTMPKHKGSDEKITFHDSSLFGNHLASVFLNCHHGSADDISILDFGGGDGTVAHSVAERLVNNGVRRVEILLIDYNEKAMSPRDSRIAITRRSSLEGVNLHFSLVIASGVVEHLPRPQEILPRLLHVMANGAVFYARTPYVLPLMRMCRPIGIKWDFTYPAHVHDLGQDFWEAYFNRITSAGEFRILASNPSLVETTFRTHFLRTVAAHVLKAPWRVLGKSYRFVGGWEIFVQKVAGKNCGTEAEATTGAVARSARGN